MDSMCQNRKEKTETATQRKLRIFTENLLFCYKAACLLFAPGSYYQHTSQRSEPDQVVR